MPRLPAALIVLAIVASGCAPAPETQTVSASATPVPATASPRPSASPRSTATPEPTPALVAADLDGVLVEPALAHRLPLAVSIDDNRVARPQSGFNGASIVWQAPADGYETRYLLLYQEGDSSDIGPVRSSRIYQAQWSSELLAGLAHYGGDKLTLSWIRAHRDDVLTDVDALGTGSGAFHRIKTRKPPHNGYTSTADVRRVAEALGGSTGIDPGVHVRPFRDDTPAATRPARQTIAIPYRTVSVGYVYDPEANRYTRTLDGSTHVDPADGAAVTARTVVVLYMTFRTDSKIEPGHARPVLGFTGSGKATIFMEGAAIAGTWSKAGESAPTLILGPDGKELPLVRGRIFMQAVPIGTKVAVKP
jgi:hypothetical protein